jgi:hypothetical protein
VRGAGSTFSPLDKAWGLDKSRYSPALQRHMVWLSGLLPYGQAEAVMARIGHQQVSISSLWRSVQQHSAALAPAPDRPDPVVAAKVVTLSMDGGLVHVRGEGWKEFKVGLVGQGRPTENSIQTTALAYTAVLGDVDAFAPTFRALVSAYTGLTKQPPAIIADGAAWIWGIAERDFPESVQIVDWYHTQQHLSAAAQALFPADPKQAAAWLQRRSADLYTGQVQSILLDLDNAGYAAEQHFFQTHQARMAYAIFRAAGYPIGSGSVESEVKQFKARLTGAGMRWSRRGADHMLLVRAAVLDGSFDRRWTLAA